MKRISFLIAILWLSQIAFPTKLAVLTDFGRPAEMAINDSYLYVSEGGTVFIYSRNNYKLKTKIGGTGEGPKNFMIEPGELGLSMTLLKDSLSLSTDGKIAYYSCDGKYIKEKRTPPSKHLRPFADKLIGLDYLFSPKSAEFDLSLNIYDNRFKKIKEISRRKSDTNVKGNILIPLDMPNTQLWNDKAAVKRPGEGFNIDIFDSNGNKTASIQRNYEKLKVTGKFKDKFFEMISLQRDSRHRLDWIKKTTHFRTYFPAIAFYTTADGKLYIFTYKESNGKQECFIYDFNGKFIKQVFLPLAFNLGIRPTPHAIKNDKLFQLIENEDEETWELHVCEIK